jgi:hypothetical protein
VILRQPGEAIDPGRVQAPLGLPRQFDDLTPATGCPPLDLREFRKEFRFPNGKSISSSGGGISGQMATGPDALGREVQQSKCINGARLDIEQKRLALYDHRGG